jgi:glycosyltransferase involved in cell wall biosynthesis
LLYTGNLDGYQNLELLLASIGLVRARVPDALLVLATHATPRDLSLALRRPADGIRLVSTQSFATVRDLLQVADVALCPRQEWSGFPMKLLNYMAAGKAVVVSAGSAKAVRHEVNGWIVEDRSPVAYADAIVGLLTNPALRSKLGAAARRTVEDEYGWERMIDQVEATYRRVLARRSEAAYPVSGLIGGRECVNRP